MTNRQKEAVWQMYCCNHKRDSLTWECGFVIQPLDAEGRTIIRETLRFKLVLQTEVGSAVNYLDTLRFSIKGVVECYPGMTIGPYQQIKNVCVATYDS